MEEVSSREWDSSGAGAEGDESGEGEWESSYEGWGGFLDGGVVFWGGGWGEGGAAKCDGVE